MTASCTARGLEPRVAVLKNAWSAGMVNWVRSAFQKASSSRTPMSAGMRARVPRAAPVPKRGRLSEAANGSDRKPRNVRRVVTGHRE